MTYISRCEHGTPMALCQKCFPDVSEHNDWSKYVNTHPVKDLEDIDINITWNENSMRDFGKDELNFAKAILKKASEK